MATVMNQHYAQRLRDAIHGNSWFHLRWNILRSL